MSGDEQNLLRQSSTLPPAQPTYILRGHAAQIHAVHFFSNNTRLITGDADGWVIVWDVPIRRPEAVWRAHQSTILGLSHWSDDKLITHGRDGRLCVWQYPVAGGDFSKVPPVEDASAVRKAPWLLHSLTVHTLNFCSFASHSDDNSQQLVIAVPGLQDGSINVTELPSEARLATIPPPQNIKTGMLMAVGISGVKSALLLIAGYESGHAAVWSRSLTGAWQTIYIEKAHSQPVLSLDIAHWSKRFFTSSADAIIASHTLQDDAISLSTHSTKHAGQQSLCVRSDERIFATAGWDGRIRVYSSKTCKELAVLKWHKDGCYACAFAPIYPATQQPPGQQITVAQRRVVTTKDSHWLAAGSKDGKVSLWQVY